MRVSFLAIVLVTALSFSARATVLHVEQDGSGQFNNIYSAVSFAAPGDSIAIGPGEYVPPATLHLTKALTFFSTDGPEQTIINGNRVSPLFWVELTTAGFHGLTITHTEHDVSPDHCILVDASTATFNDCRFFRNNLPIMVTGPSGTVHVARCLFRDNGRIVGIIYNQDGPLLNLTVTQSTFIDTGGIDSRKGPATISQCLFIGRSSVSLGDAVTGSISNNTLDGSAGIALYDANVSVHHNIFANGLGNGISLDYGTSVPHYCNLFFNNALGNIWNGTLGVGEVVADPLFCERYHDYTLAAASPALAANNSCGTMGAFGAGCATTTIPANRTIAVRQNGGGDFMDIQDGIYAAIPGDTVEVGDGVYPGDLLVRRRITLRSLHGPELTVIDGHNQHRCLAIDYGLPGVVRGFSFVNGKPAIETLQTPAASANALVVQNCAFKDNTYPIGAAMTLDRNATVSDCTFEGNMGGAILHFELGNYFEVSVRNCRFVNNEVPGGVIFLCDSKSLDIENCLFAGNVYIGTPGDSWSAIFTACRYEPDFTPPSTSRSDIRIVNNTFFDNQSGSNGATIAVNKSTADNFYADIHGNIFAGERVGAGLWCLDGVHDCNVFWNNAGGALKGTSLASAEVVADPLFCDPDSMLFTISDASPAAPAQSLCGELIGAFPVDCHGVATLISEFRARSRSGGVDLAWRLISDDVLVGYRVLRRDAATQLTVALPEGGLLPPSAREWRDESVLPGHTYQYTLMIERDGDAIMSPPVSASVPALANALSQNTPNPFRDDTRIDYTLERAGAARVTVYDVRGALVRRLIDGTQPAGAGSVIWNGKTESGERAATGIYFVRMETKGFSAARKLLFIR